MWAAAISPWEWPTTAAGSTPKERHSPASETMIANSTGWTTSIGSSVGWPGSPRSTPSSSKSTWGASASAQARIRSAKTGERSSSSTAIPGHWPPWPGKRKTGAGPASGSTTPSTTCAAGAPSARPRSPSSSRSGVVADHHRAVGERRARGRERVADVLYARPVVVFELCREPPRALAQRRRALGGEHKRQRRRWRDGALRRDRLRRGPWFRRGVEDDVAVGAADAERADAGHGRTRLRPGLVTGLDAQAELVKRNVRVRLLEVETRRDLSVLHAQGRLDQARDSRRGLQVADVGLGGADEQRPVGGAAGAEHAPQRGCLDAVAERRAGAVELDVGDLLRRDPGAFVGEPQQLLLGLRVGRGQPVAAAVVVHGAAADDAEDRVAVRHGRLERLEHDHAAALAAYEPVRPGVEREAAPVGRQRPELEQGQSSLKTDVQLHAARQGERRLSGEEALAGQVDRDERRGLPGVDRHAGPSEAERVGHTVGDDALLSAGEGLAGYRVDIYVLHEVRVIARDGADENTGLAARERVRREPASSSASQLSSSASRCCGSIAAASRGEIPKNAASKRSTCSRNPPNRRPGIESSGRGRPSSSERSLGVSVIASRPSRRSFQNASGFAAPGRRHDIPITATPPRCSRVLRRVVPMLPVSVRKSRRHSGQQGNDSKHLTRRSRAPPPR